MAVALHPAVRPGRIGPDTGAIIVPEQGGSGREVKALAKVMGEFGLGAEAFRCLQGVVGGAMSTPPRPVLFRQPTQSARRQTQDEQLSVTTTNRQAAAADRHQKGD
jgi:hypothetical protein